MKLHLRTVSILASLALAAGALGCSSNADCLGGGADCISDPNQPPPGTPPGQPPPGPDPKQCGGRLYTGFDGVQLHADRPAVLAGVDHGRVKPFSALSGEFPRVLGATPASLQAAASTFGAPAARWYEEPQSSAVALQTAYSVSFDGCLTYTQNDAKYGAAPTQQSAETVCSEMARKFWSKTPTSQEIASCVDVATIGSAAEPNARRRWAYACASVLTSAGFLTY